MSFENTSWLGSAGGITSNPQDIAVWTGDIFRNIALTDSEFSQFTQVVSPFTGKPEHDLSKPGYGLGVFRINTPVGLIWFTPGLTSGYRSMLSYMPCTNIAITYTMTSSDMYHHGSAKFLLMNLYKTILKNKQVMLLVKKYQKTHHQPEYCSSLAKDKKFIGLGVFFKH
jgi:D-alanyl-D-alanine carboxypeptidase